MTYTTKDIVEKFKIVASSNDRTVSKELEHMIKQVIKQYEQEHGEIKVEED